MADKGQLQRIAPEEIAALDKLAGEAVLSFGNQESFADAFAVADAMVSLRAAITPAMMTRITALQDSPLGFRTDKDPKQWNQKKNAYNVPYEPEIVKDCAIEARLRGVQWIGNQFNIIANRCYITREGYEYKIKKLPGLADFKPLLGIPKRVQDGAIIPCSATWVYKGKSDSFACEIPVRVNEGMLIDAMLGKCQRKFLKRVFEILTGTSDPDGDANEQLIEGEPPKPTAKIEAGATEATPEKTEKRKPTDHRENLKLKLAEANISPAEFIAFAIAKEHVNPAVKELDEALSAIPLPRLRPYLESLTPIVDFIGAQLAERKADPLGDPSAALKLLMDQAAKDGVTAPQILAWGDASGRFSVGDVRDIKDSDVEFLYSKWAVVLKGIRAMS